MEVIYFFLLIFIGALVVLFFVDLALAELLTLFSMVISANDESRPDFLIFTIRDVWRMRKEIHKREEVNSK